MLTTKHARREPIGAFETIDGAERAATHLVELRYDPDHVAIAPRDFVVVEPCRLRDRLRPAVRRGSIISSAGAGAVGSVMFFGVDAVVRVLAVMLIAAVIGGAFGVVVAVVQHRRSRFLSRIGSASELRPQVFDVVVDRDAARARHDLARWWDPAAPPIRRGRAA